MSATDQLIHLRSQTISVISKKVSPLVMKRTTDPTLTVMPLDKKQRTGEWMPPSWLKTWKLYLPWLRTKDGKHAIGSNVVTTWTQNQDKRWERRGTKRWYNPMRDLERWRETNEDLMLDDRPTYSLESEDVMNLQERKIMMVYGKGRRTLKRKEESGLRFNELLLFLYWNFDIHAVDYYIREKDEVGRDKLPGFSVVEGVKEEMTFISYPINDEGIFVLEETPDGFHVSDRNYMGHDWLKASSVNRWDVGEDALLLYGNQDPYSLEHIKDPIPSLKRFEVLALPTVLEEQVQKEGIGVLWYRWMYNSEIKCDGMFRYIIYHIGLPRLYQDSFDTVWSLCVALRGCKDEKTLLVFDLWMLYFTSTSETYKVSKIETLWRMCGQKAAMEARKKDQAQEIYRLTTDFINSDNPYEVLQQAMHWLNDNTNGDF